MGGGTGSGIGKKPEELVPTLKSLKAAGGTAYADMISVLDSAVAMAEASGTFSEIGKSSRGIGNTSVAKSNSETKVETIAKGYMEKDPNLSYVDAIAKAWENNPDLCFILCGLLNEVMSWDTKMWTQMLICTVLITVVEFLSGIILNIWLGLGIWDYSNMPLNILGQICVPFSLLWYFLSAAAIILDDYLRYWFFGEEKPHYIWRFGKW